MFPNVKTQDENVNANNSKSGKRSFLFDFSKGDFVVHDGKVSECDGEEALKVWIEKILHTEKSRFEIYLDTEYGCKLEDLIVGSNYSSAFIESELKREVCEALLSNPSITAITNFKLERSSTALIVSLEVKTDDERTNIITATF